MWVLPASPPATTSTTNRTPSNPHLPHPTTPSTQVVILYVDEEESVRRQMRRAQLAAMHNKRVMDAGAGDVWDVRTTDVNEALCRRRYQARGAGGRAWGGLSGAWRDACRRTRAAHHAAPAPSALWLNPSPIHSPPTPNRPPRHAPPQVFKAHYHTILRLKSFFPFSLIDAMGTLEEARQQIMRELVRACSSRPGWAGRLPTAAHGRLRLGCCGARRECCAPVL